MSHLLLKFHKLLCPPETRKQVLFRDENVDTYFRGAWGTLLFLYLFDSPEACFMSLDVPWGLVCYFYTSSNRQSRNKTTKSRVIFDRYKTQTPKKFTMILVLQNWAFLWKLYTRSPKEEMMRTHPIVVEETPRGGVVGNPAVKEVPSHAPPIRVASLLSDFFQTFCILYAFQGLS